MNLVFQEQSEDRQFEPGREQFIFPSRAMPKTGEPGVLTVVSYGGDGLLASPLGGVVDFTPPSKVFSSPIRMSTH